MSFGAVLSDNCLTLLITAQVKEDDDFTFLHEQECALKGYYTQGFNLAQEGKKRSNLAHLFSHLRRKVKSLCQVKRL